LKYLKKLIIISIIPVLTIFLKNFEYFSDQSFNPNYQLDNIYKFVSNGQQREYLLHIPENIQEKAPLVFVLHGLRSTSAYIRQNTLMDSVADKNGFLVCYPQGSSSTKRTIYTDRGSSFWNVGYDIHKDETVDDISFLKSLAVFLQQKYNLDSEKTFCSGMSNGGDMSYLLACEAPDVFKAIASVTGCMMGWIYDSCNKNDPVPVFQLHGTRDNTTYYDGDSENKDKWGAYLGVESSIKFWVDRNQCTLSVIDTLPDSDSDDGSRIVRKKYLNGINKNEVWFYKIINGGHEWPLKNRKYLTNRDINMSEEIWKFFSNI
jgi:polyhydroxybutyrate depolymerase